METPTEAVIALQDAIDVCLDNGMSMNETKTRFEKILIGSCLARAGNNQVVLAESVGIHRNTLSRRMKRLGVGQIEGMTRRFLVAVNLNS